MLFLLYVILLYTSSPEGEEDYCCGTAEATPVRDRAYCENVWRPRNHSTDAVHEVRATF